MESYQIVCEELKKMDISFDLVEHPPALTTEEADRSEERRVGKVFVQKHCF